MLNNVHKNILEGHPLCGTDKWADNHYAIDSQTHDTSTIITYINSKKAYYYCEASSKGEASSARLHYVFDPCGWGVQLNMKV